VFEGVFNAFAVERRYLIGFIIARLLKPALAALCTEIGRVYNWVFKLKRSVAAQALE
jgi:hypothetical protein